MEWFRYENVGTKCFEQGFGLPESMGTSFVRSRRVRSVLAGESARVYVC